MLSVAMGYFAWESEDAGSSDTSHAAHIGGIVAGFCFAMPLLRDVKLEMLERRRAQGLAADERSPFVEKGFIAFFMVTGVGYILFGLLWFWSHDTPTTPGLAWWDPWDPEEDWCSQRANDDNSC